MVCFKPASSSTSISIDGGLLFFVAYQLVHNFSYERSSKYEQNARREIIACTLYDEMSHYVRFKKRWTRMGTVLRTSLLQKKPSCFLLSRFVLHRFLYGTDFLIPDFGGANFHLEHVRSSYLL